MLFAPCAAIVLCVFARQSVGQDQAQPESEKPRLHGYFLVKPAPNRMDIDSLASLAASSLTQTLPLSTVFVDSSRDGNHYRAALVGKDPFNGGGSVSVPTYIVPLIIRTHKIGTSFDPETGIVSTTPGIRTFNPTVADTACLTSPNDVPLTLLQESPIFKPATFDFGGTVVGRTQYGDAFQRANFWKVDDHDTYHVRLGPVKTLAPVVIDAPAAYGLALARSALGPPALCAPLGLIDVEWFENLLAGTVIPALAAQGVNPSTFPVFLVHNVAWASPVTNLNTCCATVVNSVTGVPLPIQTYSAIDFDSTEVFGTDTKDTYYPSAGVGLWMNNPFFVNDTPLWGNVGSVVGCDPLLDVIDPLIGTPSLRIAMPNGFTYHLPELAFFSWFFGAPSVGVNGWFSNNATFLTDAGPPCH
jgi:hypothetical protein